MWDYPQHEFCATHFIHGQAYTINRDGNVFIDKLGQLSIVGKTISHAETSLKKRFESVFSTMGGQNPSTFFDLSVGKLKSININIIGEAFAPGIHSLHPFSTISTALIQTGGIDTTGSLRSIKLIRNGSQSAELDFYDFLILATGSELSYFGHDKWKIFSPGLKNIEDATFIRGKILKAFEKAERIKNTQAIKKLMKCRITRAQ